MVCPRCQNSPITIAVYTHLTEELEMSKKMCHAKDTLISDLQQDNEVIKEKRK